MLAARLQADHLASLRLSPRRAFLACLVAMAASLACIALTPPAQWAAGFLLAFSLAWASAVDVDRFILPDILTLGLVVAGLATHAIGATPEAQLDAAIGAVTGYGALALTALAYRRLRGRDGVGLGDAKLLAAAGAWLGWQALPGVLLGASAAGLLWALPGLVGRRGTGMAAVLPFGPFISLAFYGVWLFVS